MKIQLNMLKKSIKSFGIDKVKLIMWDDIKKINIFLKRLFL